MLGLPRSKRRNRSSRTSRNGRNGVNDMTTYEFFGSLNDVAEGATTLEEVEVRLSSMLEMVRNWRERGVWLAAPIEKGHLRVVTDDAAVAQLLGFQPVDEP